MRTLREAIESHDRLIIQHTLRRGWLASPSALDTPGLAWSPTLCAALGNCYATVEELEALRLSMAAMRAYRVAPDDWPTGDRYTPPPGDACDYLLTWEWWPGKEGQTRDGWFRGHIDWTGRNPMRDAGSDLTAMT